MKKTDVHTGHCCVRHGCKYGKQNCSVTTLRLEQEYPCEYCEDYDNGEVIGHAPILKGREGVINEIKTFDDGIARLEQIVRGESNKFVIDHLKGMVTALYIKRSFLKNLLKTGNESNA